MRDLIDGLRVFRVPLKMTVYADTFVLATSAADARVQAIKIPDLGNLFDLEDIGVIADDKETVEFTNHVVPSIEPGEPTPVPHNKYDPTSHPDFEEDIHTVEPEDESDNMDDAAREGGPFTS